MPCYLGTVPFPASAVLSGLTNAALVWAAGCWTASPRVAALPLWTWLLAVVAMIVGGAAGNRIFDGSGVLHFSLLLLVVIGLAPAAWVLRQRQRSDC
ncbi:MAG: hypothetical protein K2Q25_05355 [Mycobacteriaceae bacterium]|nr:hypothetical protein [Mycobacteriaceae bacterium]